MERWITAKTTNTKRAEYWKKQTKDAISKEQKQEKDRFVAIQVKTAS
jgi:hypothetical protein